MAAERVERLIEADEIAGNQLGSLVDKLIERMLAVRAWLAPEDRSRLVLGDSAVESDMLAVRLHGKLLEIGGEALEILIVRQDGDRLGVEEVVVPDSEEAHERGQILPEGRCAEVLVHFVEAG